MSQIYEYTRLLRYVSVAWGNEGYNQWKSKNRDLESLLQHEVDMGSRMER